MVKNKRVRKQHKTSTVAETPKMLKAQQKSRQSVTTTASVLSGGHGSRTRNRFPGTTFPVWPLAIRLPSGRSEPFDEPGGDKPRTAGQ